jgi:predicted dehydrogenase
MPARKTSRREFLKTATATTIAAGAAPAIGRAIDAGQQETPRVSPNDRIQIATLGIGGQGFGNTSTALRVPGVELVAAADVYDGRLIRTRELYGDHIFTTRDYREVLARPDVDAVIIATPDHWHARMAIDAMEAGKDVYLEKPMMQVVEEGPPIIEAEKKSKRILQIGSQRVSSIIYEKARQIVASGAIGQVNVVEAMWDRNSALGAWQYSIPPDATPENIDWDRFLGHAPRRPFEPIRLFRWRNYQDYGTGVAGDLFVHMFSGIHYVLGSNGPTRILSTGGLRFWHDGRDVPDVMLALYDYPKTDRHPDFTLFLKVNFAAGGGESHEFHFVGSEGTVSISGAGVTLRKRPRPEAPGFTIGTFPRAVQEQYLKEYRQKYPEETTLQPSMEEMFRAPAGYSDTFDHFVVFFNAVRSRTPVIQDGTFGLRAAGPAALSNVSYFEDRPVYWDPVKMQVRPDRPVPSASR